jgi:transposase-like protein
MNVNCPDCNKINPIVLDTRMTVRGVRRRRYECQGCHHRWTVFTKEIEGRPYKSKWETQKELTDVCRRLSSDDARTIVLSPEPQRVLAARYGVTRQSISLIQNGLMYKNIYEEIYPPRTGPMIYCTSCRHWGRNRCGFGFPDAGDTFATECSVYMSN